MNNNNDNKYDISLNNKTILELYKIADENGASILAGLDKKEAMEAVKLILKRKREAIEKQEYQRTMNPFNKDIDLTIKEGIDPLELLFWKIFRNKFIFRQIMSNMSSHLTIPYHSNISVIKILDGKLYDLLRDKVITNQYLSFKPLGSVRFGNDAFYSVFNHIKSDKDTLFYKQLFKNYYHYIEDLVKEENIVGGGGMGGIEKLASEMINSRCMVGLQVFEKLKIQDKKVYTPSQLNLDFAISQGALKFIDYLLQPQFNLKVILSNINTKPGDQFKILKSLNHLCNQKVIDNNSTEYYNLINKTLALSKLNIYSSVKSLLLVTKIILEYSNKPNGAITGNIEGANTFLKEIESLRNNLTKKFMLINKCNQLEPNKSIIKKSLELFYSIPNGKKEMPAYYHIFFGEDGKRADYKDAFVGNFKLSFQFADFQFFDNLFEQLDDIMVSADISDEMDISSDFVFSHCPNKEKRLGFVNSIIQFVTAQPNPQNLEMGPIFIFYLIVECDDLEIIKHASNAFGNHLSEVGHVFDGNGRIKGTASTYGITRHIKSIEVFDWLYKNHKIHFKTHWWYYSSLELFQHCESIYCNENGGVDNIIKRKLQLTEPPLDFYSDIMIKKSTRVILEYIIRSGNQIYNFSNIWTVFRHLNNDPTICKLFYLNFIHGKPTIQFRQATTTDHSIIISILNNTQSSGLTKFLDWLYINYQYEFEQGGIFDGPLQYKQDLLFGISRYSTLDFTLENIKSWHIFEIGNSILLDLAMKSLITIAGKKITIESKVFPFILSAVEYGNLKSIEYINNNYTLKKTPSNNGLLGNDNLKKLIFKSLQLGFIQITSYLFDIILISKEEFDANSNILSKSYFKIQ